MSLSEDLLLADDLPPIAIVDTLADHHAWEFARFPAAQIASIPLRASPAVVITKPVLPSTRPTLRAPMLPLAKVRMSFRRTASTR